MYLLKIILQAPPPTESQEGIGYIFFFVLFVIIVLVIYNVSQSEKDIRREKGENIESKEETYLAKDKKNIPAICPHCKNPNPKKLRECEWCGNKIY